MESIKKCFHLLNKMVHLKTLRLTLKQLKAGNIEGASNLIRAVKKEGENEAAVVRTGIEDHYRRLEAISEKLKKRQIAGLEGSIKQLINDLKFTIENLNSLKRKLK